MICAVKDCRKTVPEIARAQGDPYCSSVCFRVAHGYTVKVGTKVFEGEDLEDYEPAADS